MPAIELPKFNGYVMQWQAFYDLFLMLVHNNRRLHEVEKFLYLKSSLQSEASALVSTLPVTNANYEVPRNLLLIFNAPLVSSDCVQSIKGLLNLVTENIGVLKVICLRTDQWNAILLNLLVRKLDCQLREQ
ncbi:hypothetical protein PR048_023770 [Dryococelus australis]|uniref:Uncharacterized protein n=1 Tax=Dryococelus australis TaxID=614101 RepID=A0ABQ9GV14_9NEOP|nr:hypothetical protein PR048_023770 [Dryococelus australis]